MSQITKLVKSDAGPIKVTFLHCDNCAKQVQEGGEIGWIATSSNIQRIAHPPLSGDFCSPACVVAYYSWKQGEPLPVGVVEANRIKMESMPRYEVRDHGRTIYSGNDEFAVDRFLS